MAADGSDAAVFELKPMGLGDLLDVVIRLYRRHFGQIVRIAAVVYVPLGVLQVVSAALMFQAMDMDTAVPSYYPGAFIAGGIGYALWIILFWLSMPLVQGAIAKAVAEYYLGREATVASAYGFALRRWPMLIAVAILGGLIAWAVVVVGVAPAAGLGALLGVFAEGADSTTMVIAIGLGALLLLIALHASLAIGVRLFFAALVVVLEEEGAIRALMRSWELTSGHFWRILFALLVLWLLVMVLTGIIVWPAQIASYFLQEVSFSISQALLSALSSLGTLLLQPVQVVATVLLYYDLRMRKEGFDLAMMAEAIGEPQLAVRTGSGEAAPALFGPSATHTSAPVETDEPADTDHPPRA